MNATRIIKATFGSPSVTKYVPQWLDQAGKYREYIGYEPDSPYLHAMTFNTIEEAREFLRGECCIFTGSEVTVEVIEP